MRLIYPLFFVTLFLIPGSNASLKPPESKKELVVYAPIIKVIEPIKPKSIIKTVKAQPNIIKTIDPVKAQPPVIQTLYNPNSSINFSAQDIMTIDPNIRKYIRYISLYNIPKEFRKQWGQTLSFMINSLSRRKQIYIPVFVGGSDETVIRINIKDYDWDSKVFNNFIEKGSGVKPTPEPYFYALVNTKEVIITQKVKKKVVKKVPVRKTVPAGYYDSLGQAVYKIEETFEEKVEEVEEEQQIKQEASRVVGPGSWLDQAKFGILTTETLTDYPIARGDWFFTNISVPPAYYDFLGLGKTQKDFQNLIFTDDKLAEKARSQYKSVVITSTVARNNRTLTRSPTFTDGYYWLSHDSKTSVDDRQYILNFLREKFDATEEIGTLPNGLQAYFLTNGNGDRLDFADPDIAIDNMSVDRLVRSGRSCIVCHSDGIRPIEDEIRTLTKKLKNLDSVRLLAKNEDDAYKIADLFGTNLDEKIVLDQNIYARAVAESTGLKTDINAKQFNLFYNQYSEILVSLDDMAREVGVNAEDLRKYARISLDPVILGILKTPSRPVRRDQWERSFHNFMVIVSTSK